MVTLCIETYSNWCLCHKVKYKKKNSIVYHKIRNGKSKHMIVYEWQKGMLAMFYLNFGILIST